MWHEVLIALCLLFVLEGIVPFVAPRQWRQAVAMVSQMGDRKVRLMGLASMLVGTVLLYLVN